MHTHFSRSANDFIAESEYLDMTKALDNNHHNNGSTCDDQTSTATTMTMAGGLRQQDVIDHDHHHRTTPHMNMPLGLRVYYDATLEEEDHHENNDGSVIGMTMDQSQAAAAEAKLPLYQRLYHKWLKIYHKNSFLILVSLGILLAYAYPPLGATYVAPHITATWIAVIFIFLMAGMGIKTDEFAKALQRVYFNTYVQIFDFVVCSAVVYGFTRFMLHVNALPQSLADGMTICSTLSVSVNMGIVLTKLVGGDEAAAVFDAAFGNFLGVFVSPFLILMYLGLDANIDLVSVVLKLFLRVVLPLLVGQCLRNFLPPAKAFINKYGKYFRDGQEYCLAFIVYTIFCKTFKQGSTARVSDVFIMIGCILLMLVVLMIMAWTSLHVLFHSQPKLVAMGLFGCTHKTVAVGIPLVSSIYAGDPNLALYVLPLLIWYTMQLILGTAAAPYIAAYIIRREKEIDEERGGLLPTTAASTTTQHLDTLVVVDNSASPPSPSETIGSIESGSAASDVVCTTTATAVLQPKLEQLECNKDDELGQQEDVTTNNSMAVTHGNA